MILLIVAIALWWATHLFPVFAHGQRNALAARFGEGTYKLVFSLVSIIVLALVVIAYQRADFVAVWSPPLFMWHLNNFLVALAVFVFFAGYFPSFLRRRIRHPMLTGVKLWAVAHLLVNGDLASIVLFLGFLGWAVVAVIGINRRDGPRGTLPEATRSGLFLHIGATAVLFGAIGWLHGLAGVTPFPA